MRFRPVLPEAIRVGPIGAAAGSSELVGVVEVVSGALAPERREVRAARHDISDLDLWRSRDPVIVSEAS